MIVQPLMEKLILEARGIIKDYPSVKVLRDVDISVPDGATLAVIGPNGAGKTTLFKVLSGEIFADRGTVSYGGKNITRMPAWRRVRAGFGRSFQIASVFKDLTAAENVLVSVEAFSVEKLSSPRPWLGCRPSPAVRDQVEEALEEVGLADKGLQQARFLSHGDKKRLELAMSLAQRPRILLLDEPTAGMAPGDRQKAIDLIATLRARHGMTVVLTEHDMGVVFGLASHVVVLHHGQLIAAGTPAEVRENPLVREVYLGTDETHA